MASVRKVEGANGSLKNKRGLQLETARILHRALPVPVLLYGGEIVREKKKD